MISVCIPIYNFDVTELVKELHFQTSNEQIPFQILLIDDASKGEFRIKNQPLSVLENVEYIQLERNLGRTGIRNLLAEKATYSYLLFLDCDSKPMYGDYIKRFLVMCQPEIICSGGRAYLSAPSDKQLKLHWCVGVNKEVVTADQRAVCPNRSFMSCNFLIDKGIFQNVKFDERLKGYCNEDTLFGFELEKKGIIIQHIDNPLYHIGLESSKEFLEKIEDAIRNLHKIDRFLQHDPRFIQSVTLMKFYYILKKFHLTSLTAFSFRLLKNTIKRNLFGNHPNMKLYDYYKIGYLCHTGNHSSKL